MNDQTPSGNAKDDETPPSNGRRMLLDFGPLLLFFGANYLYQRPDVQREGAGGGNALCRLRQAGFLNAGFR